MKKINFILLLSLAAVLLIIPSCNDDNDGKEGDTSAINIRFRALLDGEPYVMNDRFTYGDWEMSVSALRFYISDLVLTQGNLEVELREIDWVDFAATNLSASGADAGWTTLSQGIPVGNYDGIKFGIGVSSDLNAEDPTTYASGHPLRNTDDYWADWGSYIFNKIEGRYDNDDNPDLESAFNYHIGGDPFYRVKLFGDLDITIAEGQTPEMVIHLEIRDIMKAADAGLLDLPNVGNNGNVHTMPSQTSIAGTLADNWQAAFTLE